MLDESLYFTDHLHLVEEGDEKLAKSIVRLVKELLEADEAEGDSSVSRKKLLKVHKSSVCFQLDLSTEATVVSMKLY